MREVEKGFYYHYKHDPAFVANHGDKRTERYG